MAANAQQLTIGTFNMRTAGNGGFFGMAQTLRLGKFVTDNNIQALAIQEHHIYFDGNKTVRTAHLTQHGYTMFYTAATREISGDSCVNRGGVGLLLHRSLTLHPPSFTAVSPRIFAATLKPRPDLTIHIICVYAPTAVSPAERAEFFSTLRRFLPSLPRQEMRVVAGDLNSILRASSRHPLGSSFQLSHDTQAAAQQFEAFLQHHDLIAPSGLVDHPHKITFFPPEGSHRMPVQLDYVVTDAENIGIVRSTTFYQQVPLPSDHRPTATTFDLALPELPQPAVQPRVKPPNLRLLRTDAQARNEFNSIYNRQTQLSLHGSPLTPEHLANFHQAIAKAAEALGHQNRPRALIAAKHRDIQQLNNDFDDIDPADMLAQRQLLQRMTQLRGQLLDEELATAVAAYTQNITDDPAQAHRYLRTVFKGDNVARATITADTPEHRLQLIANTCAAQLNNKNYNKDVMFDRHNEVDPTKFKTSPITTTEMDKAIGMASNNKAPGWDQFYTEFLASKPVRDHVLQLLNHCLQAGVMPDELKTTVFTMIPKPGAEHTKPEGYRYIALMPHITKLYNIILRERIVPVIDPFLRRNQNGFRAKRSTLQQIIALQSVMDFAKVHASVRGLYIVFIDFKNAFPSVSHASIRAALAAFQVPDKLITAIMSVYEGHKGYVRTPDGDTPKFDITAGVLQGDTLAPYLFLLVLNEVLRKAIPEPAPNDPMFPGTFTADRARRRTDATKYAHRGFSLRDIDYADDIALIELTLDAAEALLRAVQREAEQVGLFINTKKTQFVVTKHDGITLAEIDRRGMTDIHGAKIDRVTNYRYLGRHLGIDTDIKARIGAGWAALRKLDRVWKSQLDSDGKRRLFRTFVTPTMLYAMCTYPITYDQYFKISGAYTRMLRRALNVDHDAHLTIETLYGWNGDGIRLELAPVVILRFRMNVMKTILTNPGLVAYDVALKFLDSEKQETFSETFVAFGFTTFVHSPGACKKDRWTLPQMRALAHRDKQWQLHTDNMAVRFTNFLVDDIKKKSDDSRQRKRERAPAAAAQPPAPAPAAARRQTLLFDHGFTSDKHGALPPAMLRDPPPVDDQNDVMRLLLGEDEHDDNEQFEAEELDSDSDGEPQHIFDLADFL